jgi:hypothetical protein
MPLLDVETAFGLWADFDTRRSGQRTYLSAAARKLISLEIDIAIMETGRDAYVYASEDDL